MGGCDTPQKTNKTTIMQNSTAKYLYGIIGYPLGHTLSPALHTWLYQQIGLPARYSAWPLPPEDLPAFMAGLRADNKNVQGLSVTIPHKQAVMPFLDALDEQALSAGAVNTLYRQGNTLRGTNTDVHGFLYPLLLSKIAPRHALLLGCGGSARAVLAALNSLPGLNSGPIKVTIAARNTEKAAELAHKFKATPLAWANLPAVAADMPFDLIVNCTPLGLAGSSAAGQSPLGVAEFKRIATLCQETFNCSPLAYDLVYKPLQTPFLAAATTAGCATQDGLDMLLAQGIKQLQIWLGHLPEQMPEQMPEQAGQANQALKNWASLTLPTVSAARQALTSTFLA